MHERTSSMVVLGYTLDTEINAHCEPARWYILLLYGSELRACCTQLSLL